jgi:hypothetical protein
VSVYLRYPCRCILITPIRQEACAFENKHGVPVFTKTCFIVMLNDFVLWLKARDGLIKIPEPLSTLRFKYYIELRSYITESSLL